jgi:NAD(P)-dependent dehydrogenase (short-subunit alcohol dehydrogenase family)
MMTTRDRRAYAIITGAGRGIGAAIAVRLAGDGYDVVVNYASDEIAARATAEQITRIGRRALPLQADVASEDDVLRMFDTADRELGDLSALINNAGITGGFARVEEVKADQLARMLAVNVTGTMLCCREAVRRMSTRHAGQGGAIVNISSLVARTGGPGEWVHYAASKGAVDSFTIGLPREVASEESG